jgi:lactose/L-arabinose transport system substrate-binding protein
MIRKFAPFALAVTVALTAAVTSAQTSNANVKGEITLWAWKDAIAALKAADAAFLKAYPNVKVNYVQKQPADVYKQLKLAVSAGSGLPDISLIEDSNLAQYVELGALYDITDKVKPYVKQMNPYKWTAASKDGRYYAMPWDSGPMALYYRRDILQKAGVDPNSLKTWDAYVAAGKTIKTKTGAKLLPLSKAQNDARFFENLLWQQGTGYVDRNGAVVLDKDARPSLALNLHAAIWKADLAADIQPWTDPWYKAIAEGEVATLPMASWMGGFMKSWIAPKSAGQWGVVPLPTFSGSKARTSNDGGSQLAIFESSKNKDAAWAYIEFHLGRPDSQIAMYEASDFFPSLETTYNTAAFKEKDPYFGNQVARQVFVDAVKTIPTATVYTSDYSDMNSVMMTELQKFALGKQSASDTLKNAAKTIRDRTRRK